MNENQLTETNEPQPLFDLAGRRCLPDGTVEIREADLPDPPDNIREWEQLPEDFREAVADRFENGIENEWQEQLRRNVREARSKALRESRRAGVNPRRAGRKVAA